MSARTEVYLVGIVMLFILAVWLVGPTNGATEGWATATKISSTTREN